MDTYYNLSYDKRIHTIQFHHFCRLLIVSCNTNSCTSILFDICAIFGRIHLIILLVSFPETLAASMTFFPRRAVPPFFKSLPFSLTVFSLSTAVPAFLGSPLEPAAPLAPDAPPPVAPEGSNCAHSGGSSGKSAFFYSHTMVLKGEERKISQKDVS